MKIRIYQINMSRDLDNVAFLNYNSLFKYQQSTEINSSIYDKTFDGEVDCNNLEEIYQKFNCDHPKNYYGRSLSVSDVVEIIKDNSSTFHFCDRIGFKDINFNPNLTLETELEEVEIPSENENLSAEEITKQDNAIQKYINTLTSTNNNINSELDK